MNMRTLAVCALVAVTHRAVAQERSVLRQPEIADSTTAQSDDSLHIADRSVGESGIQATKDNDKVEVLQKKLRDAERLQREIEQLRAELGTQEQILVSVEMLEISLTKMRSMGFELEGLSQGLFGINDYQQLQKGMAAAGITPANLPYQSHSAVLDAFLAWLKKNNLAKVLAAPTVVVLSGRPACLFVGDELPVPTSAEPGATLEYHKCGTELDVLAVAKPNSMVRLDIRTRVSAPDEERAIKLGDATFPTLTVRQCDSCVETAFGQPVVLNGLVSSRVESVNQGGIERDEVNEVALLVIVTPERGETTVSAKLPARDDARK
jgi:Flp pilus assembly secretin CpaC